MTNKIQKNITVGDLVVGHPHLRPILEKLGIDYCCGGKKPLVEAIAASGLQWETVEFELNAAFVENKDEVTTDWNTATLSELVDHIVNTHHVFMKEQLPRIDDLLAKVQRAHGAAHGEMLTKLRRAYDVVRSELEPHLMKEEQILFPLIKEIDAFRAGTGEKPVSHCGTVANPIGQMEIEHDAAGNELALMRKLTDGYKLPNGACQTFAALYEGLATMESDLHTHIHLENNILFPKSVQQEAKIIKG
jgi:regulator of cell morphogenesis and NO signaling